MKNAAALLQSVVGNHALVDGNKPLGLATVIAFYRLNGRRFTMTNDEAYDFIMSIAGGAVDDIAINAKRLRSKSRAA